METLCHVLADVIFMCSWIVVIFALDSSFIILLPIVVIKMSRKTENLLSKFCKSRSSNPV
jgi:hypothetical protein